VTEETAVRYAILSDIHANPVALTGAVSDAMEQGCTRLMCLGDVTGYGYDSRACLRFVRDEMAVCLMGNHDSACVGMESEWEVSMNRNYRLDVRARCELDEDEQAWLRSRPYLHEEAGAVFTHGDFVSPRAWYYIFHPEDASRNFRVRTERLLFCGHTHQATVWEQDADGKVLQRGEDELGVPAVGDADTVTVSLAADARYIVNVGSVGYPRRDFCSTYVIWDTAEETVAFRRLPFDFKRYSRDLAEHDVPQPVWLNMLLDALRITGDR